MAWREPPRAFAATSGAAKNPRQSAHPPRICSSSPAPSEWLRAPGSIALVELVAFHFLARFGAEMFRHERLQSDAYRSGHRDGIDLLASIEKTSRLAVANRDDQRSSGRFGLVNGVEITHYLITG